MKRLLASIFLVMAISLSLNAQTLIEGFPEGTDTSPIVSGEWFNGSLYFANAQYLFQYNGNDIVFVDSASSIEGESFMYLLHATQEKLWYLKSDNVSSRDPKTRDWQQLKLTSLNSSNIKSFQGTLGAQRQYGGTLGTPRLNPISSFSHRDDEYVLGFSQLLRKEPNDLKIFPELEKGGMFTAVHLTPSGFPNFRPLFEMSSSGSVGEGADVVYSGLYIVADDSIKSFLDYTNYNFRQVDLIGRTVIFKKGISRDSMDTGKPEILRMNLADASVDTLFTLAKRSVGGCVSGDPQYKYSYATGIFNKAAYYEYLDDIDPDNQRTRYLRITDSDFGEVEENELPQDGSINLNSAFAWPQYTSGEIHYTYRKTENTSKVWSTLLKVGPNLLDLDEIEIQNPPLTSPVTSSSELFFVRTNEQG